MGSITIAAVIAAMVFYAQIPQWQSKIQQLESWTGIMMP